VTDQERFRRWAKEAKEAEGAPSLLIPAATVIVVRDTDIGLETLMLRRNSALAFAGGMWVFPGGRVDDDDHTDDSDELAVARQAAVREAREEAALEIDPAALVTFSHWEPPPITPKRFSTWFFLAPCPAEAAVAIDDGEIHEHAWLRPADALARRDLQEIELAPPTFVTLFELATCATVADALAMAGAREPEHFTTKVSIVEGVVYALWHGDAGYGADLDQPADATVAGPRHRLCMGDDGWHYERS
jgi:8-oxo-dGTP pyrophosphatase MutT (NUDIX family)